MEEKDLIKKFLAKIQPSADKKEKKSAYKELQNFLNSTPISEDDIPLLFEGEGEEYLGLCELAGKKNFSNKFKDSSLKIIEIIYFMLYESKFSVSYRKAFYLLEVEYFIRMNLCDHFEVEEKAKKDKKQGNSIVKIIKVINDERPTIFSDYITETSYAEKIQKLLQEFVKEDDKERKRLNYLQKVINISTGVLNPDPVTWEDVLKIKKKILTTEFLNTAASKKNEDNVIIDDEKEIQDELIRNFVNPLTRSNERLNFTQYTQEEKSKLHIQSETFDPVFFLERFYTESNLAQFSACLKILENNLSTVNTDDENLIDKNIYKYLDCKKLLDTILEKFQGETKGILFDFKDSLSGLQNNINVSLQPVKKSFEMIMKSKISKEIIHKFERYFEMKDQIENYLKFSSFEDLADYLKKSQDIIQGISQSTYIYGEFYEYFSQTIENIKNLLIKIIKNSMVPNVIVKHFKILLHFDVESETIDLLLNHIKEKICEKISKYLEETENFEIKNIKKFFIEEFQTVNMPDDYFGEILVNAENYISGDLKGEDDLMSKSVLFRKKDLINVENIILSLFSEIKEYLFMLKVIEETIMLKLLNLKTKRELDFFTIIKQIYFTLFSKLGDFLFSFNNDLGEIKENYLQKCSKLGPKLVEKEANNELFQFYIEKDKRTVFNDNFNKNTFQNLSNILIDILDLFEIYLPGEEVLVLGGLKNSMVEKNYIAFINEKFLLNINYINEENTINFFDTNMSVYNHSFFNFSKNFLKTFFRSYKNMIDFYISILRKTKDVELSHEHIIHTYFYILKNFYLKFIDFYKTESDINYEDFRKNNCLILEILKNYKFLSSEIKMITKSIFRGRFKDVLDKLADLDHFLSKVVEYFEELYTKNTAKIIFNIIFVENKTNFYGKYHVYLSDSKIFTDIRSTTVDAIFTLSDSVKDLYEISQKEKTSQLVQNILNEFIDQVADHLIQTKPILLKSINFSAQILIELQILFLVVNESMNEVNLSKRKNLLYILYNTICEIRNVNNIAQEYIDETVVFKEEEIQRKKKLISDSLDRYSTYFKCFSVLAK